MFASSYASSHANIYCIFLLTDSTVITVHSLVTLEIEIQTAAGSLELSESDDNYKHYDERLEDEYAHTSLLTGVTLQKLHSQSKLFIP